MPCSSLTLATAHAAKGDEASKLAVENELLRAQLDAQTHKPDDFQGALAAMQAEVHDRDKVIERLEAELGTGLE